MQYIIYIIPHTLIIHLIKGIKLKKAKKKEAITGFPYQAEKEGFEPSRRFPDLYP